MLRLSEVHVVIESVAALRGLSLEAEAGEMVGLLGRNGAGKTTTMRTITGLVKPTGGTVEIDGMDVVRMPPNRRAALGIGYMPEDRRLVPQLTVEENMLVPAWSIGTLDAPGRLAMIYDLMPELTELRQRKALQLSGGQQKLVALGRALMAGTRILLLDEPFEGVAPLLARRLVEVIGNLKSEDLAVLVSQSELKQSEELFDRQVVIERGTHVRDAA